MLLPTNLPLNLQTTVPCMLKSMLKTENRDVSS